MPLKPDKAVSSLTYITYCNTKVQASNSARLSFEAFHSLAGDI